MLSDTELERYSRQLVLPEWSERAQLALRDAAVAVVGAGALGAPVALYLCGAGVGRLGIVDGDAVELSNLHRQLLHFTPDLGLAKAHSAAAKLRFQNPEVEVQAFQVELNALNARIVLGEGFDLVVDCTDSFASRYALNSACCALQLPLVSGAVRAFEGLVLPIVPGESACYRCAFPVEPLPGAEPSCAEAGVLGPAAGVVGSLMALESLRLLAGLDGGLRGALGQVDLAAPALTRVTVSRRADCPDCGAL